MNDRRAFLDQVLADPDDDAARLIYADFLEEIGDPRGEFIRLQCELAEIDELHPRYLDVSHRCDQLFFEHGQAWSDELHQDVRKIAFSRGFIDKITIRARAFIKEAEQLYRTTPVHWLRFNYVKGAGPELAEVESLAKVRCLDLSQLKIPEDDMTALLMSPHLNNLQSLDLSNNSALFSQSVATALGAMRSATTLQQLDVPSGSTFLQTLARAGDFPNLQRLSIGYAFADDDISGLAKLRVPNLQALRVHRQLNAKDCEALAALPVDQLKELDLGSSRPPAKGLKYLAERGALDGIVKLSLENCGLGVRAVEVLFREQRLAHCVTLNLASNFAETVDSGKSRKLVEKLAAHQVMNRLQRLHIGGLRAGDLELIAGAPQFQNLQVLELTGTTLGGRDIMALAENPIADSLLQLKLIGVEMQPDAIKQLESGLLFPNLRRLDIGKNFDADYSRTMDDAVVVRLLTTPAFAAVRAVNLDQLFMSAPSFGALASTANLPELKELSYRYNQVSRRAIDAVMNSLLLPKLRKLHIGGSSGLGNRDKLRTAYGWSVQF
jgi:uncharacterized protein (TIGR02996 family)